VKNTPSPPKKTTKPTASETLPKYNLKITEVGKINTSKT
jgi:hypothetical protein